MAPTPTHRGCPATGVSQQPVGEPQCEVAHHHDWRWQLRRAVRTADELARCLTLSDAELAGARRAEAQGLPLSVTPYYLGLCDREDAGCPIRRQVVPQACEGEASRGEMVDPLGEQVHTVAPRLVQRYPDRVLLLASDRCATHCRFCTRSRLVGRGEGAASWTALEPALRHIAADPQLREVIVSGGDPLLMSSDRLARLVAALQDIEHVEVVRLATRAPACLPQRVDGELIEALRPHGPLWVMVHFNHPKELTAQAAEACARFVDAGFPVLNQTVLLAGVNDRAEILSELFRGLVRMRVKPYYLHQMDPVRGATHLRTPLQTGIDLMAALQGRLSGIALPKLIVDTPGGFGKVPIGPNYLLAQRAGSATLTTHRGVSVDYHDPD